MTPLCHLVLITVCPQQVQLANPFPLQVWAEAQGVSAVRCTCATLARPIVCVQHMLVGCST